MTNDEPQLYLNLAKASMPRSRDDMQVNVAGLRRNIKNLAHNYSDAQVKVREATSNDPWGPSSTLMAEIADLTYNVMAFTEIMQMIWKRLNDHGKNWRHVYKALVLMEYLIKTGSEKVAMQCKENIFAIHTLKDFQYMEEGKDQGLNVREKAKQLVNLLKDEERLKNERARALKAKQRFAQGSALGSDAALDSPASPTYPPLNSSPVEWGSNGSGVSVGGGGGGRDAELARPLTAGEEELQLQLALAMSREEAEREERRRRSDDVRLQLAISQSQHDLQLQEYLRLYAEPYALVSPPVAPYCWFFGCVDCLPHSLRGQTVEKKPETQQSHLLDLLDVNLSPSAVPPQAPHAAPLDPWGLPSPQHNTQDTSPDAWSGVGSPARDVWPPQPPPADPWAPVQQSKSMPMVPGMGVGVGVGAAVSPVSVLSSPSSADLQQFDALSQRPRAAAPPVENDPFDLSLLGVYLTTTSCNMVNDSSNIYVCVSAGDNLSGAQTSSVKKSPSAFLGENSSLVNLERLLQPVAEPPAPNPFADVQPPPPVRTPHPTHTKLFGR
ncbi:Epsin-2 [Papilio machaon]|uniref:Epsin-2 n=1 Tax=Papilio machaon TaxID=76193 RepID=A0A0N1I9Q9_PAPMA|nr:Epsin-2 [Papilio machaon]